MRMRSDSESRLTVHPILMCAFFETFLFLTDGIISVKFEVTLINILQVIMIICIYAIRFVLVW